METINRLAKIISIVVLAALIVAVGAALWAVYKYIPGLKAKIHDEASQAVTQLVPLGPDGTFSYDLVIDLSPKRCRLVNFDVTNGSGQILKDIKFNSYDFKAASVEVDPDTLFNGGTINVTGLEGVALNGEILLADLAAYYTPDNSGISNIGFEYDEFTEKVKLEFDMATLPLGRLTLTAKVTPINDRETLTLTDRKYFNIEEPLPNDIVRFIEEHTNFDLKFSAFDFPLKVKRFGFTAKSMTIELER